MCCVRLEKGNDDKMGAARQGRIAGIEKKAAGVRTAVIFSPHSQTPFGNAVFLLG
jgi:hypothetical protein